MSLDRILDGRFGKSWDQQRGVLITYTACLYSRSISSLTSLTRSETASTGPSSTRRPWSPVRRMLPTTVSDRLLRWFVFRRADFFFFGYNRFQTLVVTTPSVRSSSTTLSTEFVVSPMPVPGYKDFSSSTRSVVVLVPVSVRSSSSDFLPTTARSPSLSLPSTHPQRCHPQSLSHTTLF